MLLNTPIPCMIQEACQAISKIGDWYMNKHGVYIHVYGVATPPHVFPFLITDHMVFSEVLYQTYGSVATAILMRRKKSPWPKLPIKVGAYKVSSKETVAAESDALSSFWLGTSPFRRHDPLNIISPLMDYSHFEDKEEAKFFRILYVKDIPSNLPLPMKPAVVHTPLPKDSKAWKEMDGCLDATLAPQVIVSKPKAKTPIAVTPWKPSTETGSKTTPHVPNEVIYINSIDESPIRPPAEMEA